MLAGTVLWAPRSRSEWARLGLGLLGNPRNTVLKDGDPGHGHKPTRRGLWVGVGRQRFPARGRVFGVEAWVCLSQGLSLSLG